MITLDPATHTYTYAGTLVERSVTRVLRATIARDVFRTVKPDVLEAAAARGTYVHQATALLHEHALDWDALRRELPEAEPYLDAWQLAVVREGWTLVRPEVLVYHPTKFFAGSIDWLARERTGALAVVDIKTGSTAGARIQTAAYVDALVALARKHPDDWLQLEIPAAPLIHRLVVRLTRTGSYVLERHTHYRADLALWDACLAVYDEQRRLCPATEEEFTQ